MKKDMNVKIKWTLIISTCLLLVVTPFLSVSGEPRDGLTIQMEDPIGVPAISIPDGDWDYKSNPPHMFAIPSGNVGIGTTNPSAKLDVFGNIAVNGVEIINESGCWVGELNSTGTITVYSINTTGPVECNTLNVTYLIQSTSLSIVKENSQRFGKNKGLELHEGDGKIEGNLTVWDTLNVSKIKASGKIEGNMIEAVAGDITANEGDIKATLGNISAGKDIKTIDGNIIAENGGDIIASLGDVKATEGNIIAENGGDIKATHGNITAENGGDIKALLGNITAGKDISALGDITADNIITTPILKILDIALRRLRSPKTFIFMEHGDINASGNLTAARIQAASIDTTGDIIASLGDVKATEGNIIAENGGDIIASLGDVKATEGNIIAENGGDIIASLGDVKATEGNIIAENGGDIKATHGNITAENGGDIKANMGDISTTSGSIEALQGWINSSFLKIGSGIIDPAYIATFFGDISVKGSSKGTGDVNISGNLFAGGNVGIGTMSPTEDLTIIDTDDPKILIGTHQTSEYGVLGWKNDGGAAGDPYLWLGPQPDSEYNLILNPPNCNGNVGIGTTDPEQKLSVEGMIESTEDGFKFPDGTVQTTAVTGGGECLWSQNGNRIYYNDGNVGIGTSSPTATLDVDGNIKSTGSWIQVHPLNPLSTPFIQLVSDSTFDKQALISFWNQGSMIWMIGSDLQNENTRNFGIYDAQAGTSRFYIDNSGNVGIGTTNPTSRLDVNDDTIRIRSSHTPSSSSDDGYTGEISWDDNYMYVCISGDGPGGSTDTWKRSPLSTW